MGLAQQHARGGFARHAALRIRVCQQQGVGVPLRHQVLVHIAVGGQHDAPCRGVGGVARCRGQFAQQHVDRHGVARAVLGGADARIGPYPGRRQHLRTRALACCLRPACGQHDVKAQQGPVFVAGRHIQFGRAAVCVVSKRGGNVAKQGRCAQASRGQCIGGRAPFTRGGVELHVIQLRHARGKHGKALQGLEFRVQLGALLFSQRLRDSRRVRAGGCARRHGDDAQFGQGRRRFLGSGRGCQRLWFGRTRGTHRPRTQPQRAQHGQRQREQIQPDVHAGGQGARLLPPDDDGQPHHGEQRQNQQTFLQQASHGCPLSLPTVASRRAGAVLRGQSPSSSSARPRSARPVRRSGQTVHSRAWPRGLFPR
ncbi:hypothetical protein D3C72_1164440 [compost metagenome]